MGGNGALFPRGEKGLITDFDSFADMSVASPDALIALTEAGVFVHFSQGAHGIFGDGIDEARGLMLVDLVTPADRAEELRLRLGG